MCFRRFQMTRVDALLLAGILLTFSAVIAVGLFDREAKQERQSRSDQPDKQSQVEDQLKVLQKFDQQGLQERLKQNPSLMRRIEIVSVGILLLMIGSIMSLVYLALRVLRGVPFRISEEGPPPPLWGFRDLVRLILAMVLATQSILLVEWAALRFFRPPWLGHHLIALANTLLIDGVSVGGFCWLVLRRGHRGGWSWSRIWASLRFGIGSYLAFLPAFLLLAMAAVFILQLFNVEPTPQPAFTIFLAEKRAPVVWWLLALIAVAGPVAEELFFRGLLYRWLRPRLGIWRGLVVTALLFAVLHTNLMVFLPIFGLGLLLGWVYEQTGSLVAPIAIHVFHNGGMLALASVLKSLLAALR